eukprot:5953324-Prymnesium_polylepis.1
MMWSHRAEWMIRVGATAEGQRVCAVRRTIIVSITPGASSSRRRSRMASIIGSIIMARSVPPERGWPSGSCSTARTTPAAT